MQVWLAFKEARALLGADAALDAALKLRQAQCTPDPGGASAPDAEFAKLKIHPSLLGCLQFMQAVANDYVEAGKPELAIPLFAELGAGNKQHTAQRVSSSPTRWPFMASHCSRAERLTRPSRSCALPWACMTRWGRTLMTRRTRSRSSAGRLWGQGKDADAEPLVLTGYDGMRREDSNQVRRSGSSCCAMPPRARMSTRGRPKNAKPRLAPIIGKP